MKVLDFGRNVLHTDFHGYARFVKSFIQFEYISTDVCFSNRYCSLCCTTFMKIVVQELMHRYSIKNK